MEPGSPVSDVSLHWGGVVPPLQCPYDGPYTVLCQGPCSFTIRVGSRTRSSSSAAWRLAPVLRSRNYFFPAPALVLDFQKVSTPAPALAPTWALWVPVFTAFRWKSKFFMTFRKEYWLNSPIFKELKILPLPKLITYSELKLMHSIIYGYCPPSLRSLFQHNEQREINVVHNLRNVHDITVPFPRIELFKKSILFRLPTEWNSLTDLKLQHNKITFDIGLKEHLFSLIPND